jgi:hypothetical protein
MVRTTATPRASSRSTDLELTEENDADEDGFPCPEAEQDLLQRAIGADREGRKPQTISRDGVSP